jgi:hypothetical protein
MKADQVGARPLAWLLVLALLLALAPGQVAGQSRAAREVAAAVGPTVLPPVVPTTFRGDLRDLRRPKTIPGSLRLQLEQPDASLETASASDPAVQSSAPLANAPGPSITFAGLDHAGWGDGWPPDTNGDVGPQHFIQTVNTSVGVFRKSDGVRLAAFTFNTFFSSAATGTPCDNSNQGDPVVVYDQLANHWIISDFAWSSFSSGAMYQCFAVSITGDPVSGGWHFYAVQTDPGGHIPDYPKIGVWPDGIYMSANVFNTTGQQFFQNVRVWAFNRADMEAGNTLHAVSFDLPAKIQGISVFSLLPSNLRGEAPPAGRPNLFASIWGAYAARIWKFHVDWTTPANSTFTGPSNVSIATFAVGPATVPQKSPGNNLDTLTYRLMMQNQYRRLGSQESLWLTHTVGNGSGIASVRWYQLNVSGGTVVTSSPVQQGTFNPDATHRFMPSLAVDGSGNMAVGYSVSTSTTYPSIRYAGRLVGDPLNTLSQGETTMWTGTGAQTNDCGGSDCERWGDYSAMTVDPVDDCTFWYTNEYYSTDGGNWQTRIGAFKFPSCTGSPIPTADFALSATPSSRTVKQGTGTTYAITISRTNFTAAVDLSVTGLPAGAVGSFSPDPATGTSSTLSVTTSKSGTITPVGTYPLTITGVEVGGGLTRSTSATLVVSDGIAPTVVAPKPKLFYPTALGSTTVPVRISWSATDSSGVTSYQLQRQVDGGSWSTVSLASATTKSIDQSLTLGSQYRYRVMATDGNGNAGSWVYGRTFKPIIAQETSGAVTYTGTWTSASTTTASGGTLKFATTAGASATYSFTGSSVLWVARYGPTRGSANVYVDGVFKATVSLYSATFAQTRIVYAFNWGSNGSHTLKVEVVGTPDHPRIDVDAFVTLFLL